MLEKNEKPLSKKKNEAEDYFRKRFTWLPGEDSEDFGSYCVEKWLSGRHTATSFEFLSIDYFREYGVRYGKRGSVDLMSQPTRNHEADKPGGLDFLASKLRGCSRSPLLRNKNLLREERATLILTYEWGLSAEEIADVFGVSTQSAWQWNSVSRRKILGKEKFKETSLLIEHILEQKFETEIEEQIKEIEAEVEEEFKVCSKEDCSRYGELLSVEKNFHKRKGKVNPHCRQCHGKMVKKSK